MHSGASMFFTDYATPADGFAVAVEQHGFESIWAPERSYIPLTRKSPHPAGIELPKQYYAMARFVSLSIAAQAAKTIKVGTGVLLAQRAKLVASIDHVTKGRFLFGTGGRWQPDPAAGPQLLGQIS